MYLTRLKNLILLGFVYAVGSLLMSQAAVVLTLYNTTALLDSDMSTPLLGNAGSGDLVQFVVDGGIDGIDPPNVYGEPGGDDILLALLMGDNPSHVGAGEPPPNYDLGFLTEVATYDDFSVGLTVYVRFWNDASASAATHYGDSALFTLPAGDGMGLANFDFMASSGDHFVDTAFTAIAITAPEPSTITHFFLFLLVLGFRYQLQSAEKTGSLFLGFK